MKRKVSLCMAVLMLFSVFGMSVSAGWDGYTGTGKSEPIFSTGNVLDILDSKMVPVAKGHPEGSPSSAIWSHNTPNPMVTILPLGAPQDFSGGKGIWTWMYSAKKTGSKFAFICHKASGSYNMATLTVNWEGWKKIEVDFTEFSPNEKWNEITRIDIYATGWGMTPNPETELYLNDIYLKTDNAGLSPDIVDPKETEKVIAKSTCFYTGITSALVNGKHQKFSNGLSSFEKGGVCYVPADDLAKILGCEISIEDGKVTVNGKTVDFKAIYEGSVAFLPAAFVAEAIGKSVTVFKYLVLISDKETVEAVRRNDRMLEEIGRSVTKDNTDYSLITKEDCEAVLANWEKYLTGGLEADDSDPDVQEIKNNVEKNALSKQKTMNNSGNPAILWGNQPCTTTATMRSQYTSLLHMALGWATPGTETYHDEQLKTDILFGLEWCYENLFGEDEMLNVGWRDTWAFNWYEWQIGVPMDLSRILILLRNEISEELLFKYLRPLDYFTSEHFSKGKGLLNTNDHGANVAHTVYGYMASQLMQNKPDLAAGALALVTRDFAYQDAYKGDGPQRDGSYRFHYYYPMNGTYSVSFMESAYPLLAVTAGTKLQVSDYNLSLYADWLIKAHSYCLYDGRMLNIFKGRAPGGEAATGKSVLGWILEISEAMPESDRIKLQSFYKYFYDNGYVSKAGLSIHKLNVLNRLLKDEAIKAPENIKGFNVFYNTDKAVWQNDDYAIGISMCSARTSGWESINGENKKGWYLSDGMVYTYNKEDVNSYENAYWSNVNWYHLPGTTVDTQERVAESINDQRIWRPEQTFVGGAALNQTYGTAAMIMESCHNETRDDYKSDYGNALPLHNNDLMANKSYFIFDNEMVCLGSGVNSTMNFDVHTVLENRMATSTKNLNPNMEAIEKYEIKSVEVSETPEPENIGSNVIDGNFSTRWSAENEQTMLLDLGEVKEVGMVGIAYMYGNKRINKHDIYLSADGENWTNIFRGQSGGKTEDLEIYDGKNTQARYVRFDFHGHVGGSWNSVTEVAVYPPRKDGVIGIPRVMLVAEEKLTIDGEEVIHKLDTAEDKIVNATYTDTRNNVKWAHLENSGGFVFIEPEKISSLKTVGNVSFTEMWIEHGKNPINDTYAYVMLPSRSAEATKAYSEKPEIVVLSNTPELQAVRKPSIGVTGMVFYKAGSYDDITVNLPCIITMQKTDKALEFSLSDPTMLEKNITLSIKDLTGYTFDKEGSDARVSFEEGNVKINVAGALGEALKIRFTKN